MTDQIVRAAPQRAAMICDFARSELFARTFAEGMELVGETAAYLDGPGRQDSKRLPRDAALGYAAQSMRLTTRLMQLASWLLVQRAVGEGEMAPETARSAQYRLAEEPAFGEPGDDLPAAMCKLVGRSEQLFERVRHLDRRVYVEPDEIPASDSPVLAQMERLRGAFEHR